MTIGGVGGARQTGYGRGHLSVTSRDAAPPADPAAGQVLTAAVTGEDHAVSEYEKALDQDHLSSGFRELVTQQHAAVLTARDHVKALRAAD